MLLKCTKPLFNIIKNQQHIMIKLRHTMTKLVRLQIITFMGVQTTRLTE